MLLAAAKHEKRKDAEGETAHAGLRGSGVQDTRGLFGIPFGTILDLRCKMGLPIHDLDRAHPSGGRIDLERLSGPAIRAFLNLAEAWQLSIHEQRSLLGGVSRSTFMRWKSERDAKLSLDQLERVSHLLGIYKSLQVLLPSTANQWVRLPNEHPIFGGRPALTLLLEGGITALHRVRLHLDAQRGGWA